eukprot:COSAG01_NODE_1297_length_10848_cov_60.004279_3_plen_333_part_00
MSCVWAAFVLLMIILLLYPVIDLVPVAGLVGVMFDMIAFHIFDWGSLRTMATALLPEKAREQVKLQALKVTRTDSITVVVVAVVSIFTNLAVGVGCGVVLCSLAFAWSHGKQIQLEADDGQNIDDENPGEGSTIPFKDLTKDEQQAVLTLGLTENTWDGDGSLGEACPAVGEEELASEEYKSKEAAQKAAATLGFNADNWDLLAPKKIMKKNMNVVGTLFFGSSRVFEAMFTRPVMKASPKYVHMHFHKGEVTDFSAVSALQSVAEMFKGEGSELHLFQLSRDSHRMMIKSSKLLQDVHGFHSEEVNLQRGLDWVPNKDLADQTITDAKKRP